MSDNTKKVSFLFLILSMLFLSFSAKAQKTEYQDVSPFVKSTDRSRIITADGNLQEGFSYIFKDEVIYTPEYNTYIVGQHCYRGKPVRFDIPREKFTFYIDNQEYHPPWNAGGSVWHQFHAPARLNFLLMWLDSAYSVVELNQSACAEIVVDTRYNLEERLRTAKNTNIPIVVHDGSGKKLGAFTLRIKK